jgi:ankyrin repeat protein
MSSITSASTLSRRSTCLLESSSLDSAQLGSLVITAPTDYCDVNVHNVDMAYVTTDSNSGYTPLCTAVMHEEVEQLRKLLNVYHCDISVSGDPYRPNVPVLLVACEDGLSTITKVLWQEQLIRDAALSMMCMQEQSESDSDGAMEVSKAHLHAVIDEKWCTCHRLTDRQRRKLYEHSEHGSIGDNKCVTYGDCEPVHCADCDKLIAHCTGEIRQQRLLFSCIAAAAHYNHSKIVQYLLQFADSCVLAMVEQDPDSEHEDRRSLLHIMAHLSDPQVSQILLDLYQDMNDSVLHMLLESTNGQGRTPLLVAAACDNDIAAAALVQLGCDVNARDARGLSAVDIACESGYVHVLEVICLQGEEKLDSLDIIPQSASSRVIVSHAPPLWTACSHGHVACAQLLVLEMGAGIEVVDQQYGLTPLDIAVIRGRSDELVRFLLSFGAQVHLQMLREATSESGNSLFVDRRRRAAATMLCDVAAGMNRPRPDPFERTLYLRRRMYPLVFALFSSFNKGQRGTDNQDVANQKNNVESEIQSNFVTRLKMANRQILDPNAIAMIKDYII